VEEQHEMWFALEKDDVFKKLDTVETGLTEEESARRLKAYGYNNLRRRSLRAVFQIFLRQIHNPLIYVLLFSAALAWLLGRLTDSLVIMCLVVLNTLIGFLQEYKAHRAMKAIAAMVPSQATILRCGETKQIPAALLVPGDVVVLQAGDSISADIRLFYVKNLQCDESALTGESLPSSKATESLPLETPLAERKSMVFCGTCITAGTGLGVVVATGLHTQLGKISSLVERVTTLETPMAMTLKKLAQWITAAVFLISLGLFFIGYFRGNSLFDAAFSSIALAVAAVPEGLPAMMTIASAIGVHRMARQRVIIRQLPAIEVLGSANIICTDKTGTLTYNEMTVKTIWTPSGFSFLATDHSSLGDKKITSNYPQDLENILTAAILCSDAILDEGEEGLKPIGDPTEIAILIAGRQAGLLENTLRKTWQQKDVLPFASETRRMATLCQSPHQQDSIFLKGAPEAIMAACGVYSQEILEHSHTMAQEGMRVLAVAQKKCPHSMGQLNENDLHSDFQLLGLLGMIDMPRQEVYQALKTCHEAGIGVKMITGDHPLTAQAIARHLGILKQGKVMTGQELNALDHAGWKKCAEETQVFARVEPQHKLALVEALQELGNVVAMTGDGVNDAPALKRADIGIAMGIKGTAVAKEASDMILMDDNFACIEVAIEEGRRFYDNLIKALTFVLPANLGQALVIFFAVLWFPLRGHTLLHPLSPIQILWINLIVAVALSLPLAFEPAESGVMTRPPRKKKMQILSRFLILKTLLVAVLMALGTIGLFLWGYQQEMLKGVIEKIAISKAQTMAVTAIMLFQIVYLLSCRSLHGGMTVRSFFSNPVLFFGIGFVLLAHFTFVYAHWMHMIFQSSALDAKEWLMACSVMLLAVPLVVAEKWLKTIHRRMI